MIRRGLPSEMLHSSLGSPYGFLIGSDLAVYDAAELAFGGTIDTVCSAALGLTKLLISSPFIFRIT